MLWRVWANKGAWAAPYLGWMGRLAIKKRKKRLLLFFSVALVHGGTTPPQTERLAQEGDFPGYTLHR